MVSDVTIRFATAADLEPIRLFLRKYFITDEPPCDFLKISCSENDCEDYERYYLEGFGQGLDLVAEYDGYLVGVCLNTLLVKGAPKQKFSCRNNDAEKVIRLMEFVDDKADYFGRFPDVNRIMYLFILSVHPKFRRKGISKKLLAKTKELGKKENAELVAIECTSVFSAAVAEAMDLEKIYSLNYTDYKLNGEIVINPTPASPHKALTVYAGRI